MNYVELHLKDYAEATEHLSMLEEGALWRMIRKVYTTESPLPVDVERVLRLVRATSDDERAAATAVLHEFFELREDGWHHSRCDQELDRYRSGEPEREVKRTNEKNRVQRHREMRADLFRQLNAAGVYPDWNTKTADLRDLAAKHCCQPDTAPATARNVAGTPETFRPAIASNDEHPDGTGLPPEGANGPLDTAPDTAPATAAVMPATASQYPLPNTHIGSSGVAHSAPLQARKPKSTTEAAATSRTWDAYSSAFQARYFTAPVRNAKVMGQLAQFTKRLPSADAPEVAAFFVSLEDAYYRQRGHQVGALLQDAEALHTRWKTGARDPLGPPRHGATFAVAGGRAVAALPSDHVFTE